MDRAVRDTVSALIHILRKCSVTEAERTSFESLIHGYLLDDRNRRREIEREVESLPYVILNEAMNDDGDAWEKRLYPGENWSVEDIRTFVSDEWMYVTSPYDCSGQRFTKHISIFHRPEGMIVYIFTGLDI